jgi:hypothetical protein
MEKFGDKILSKIKEEKIEPKPKWQFLLRDCFIWLVFLVSLLVGAVAFCVSLYIFTTNDWDLYKYLHTTLVGHIFISIPYIWIILLVIFILIANYNFKHTKKGYRHEVYVVFGFSFLGSLILGYFLHSLGMGEGIEKNLASSLPFYEKMTCCGNRKDIWDQPEKGLLGGEIMELLDEENFELKDFHGMIWLVRENKNILEYRPLFIQSGKQVKIIGEKKEPAVFWAKEIRPWR